MSGASPVDEENNRSPNKVRDLKGLKTKSNVIFESAKKNVKNMTGPRMFERPVSMKINNQMATKTPNKERISENLSLKDYVDDTSGFGGYIS